tara:strand:- start:1674 stop:1868 length:195 start_codon:yes stop_codon:yes gene_type:complete
MEKPVRDLMRMSGVTLKDVATKLDLPTSTVCRALNDSLTDQVKSAARELVAERQSAVARELSHG